MKTFFLIFSLFILTIGLNAQITPFGLMGGGFNKKQTTGGGGGSSIPSPSAWYEFNTGALFTDSSPTNNTLWQPDGWTTTATNGVFGSAIWFDGVANSALGTGFTYNYTTNWSVDFWIKPDFTNGFPSLIALRGSYNSWMGNALITISNGVIAVILPSPPYYDLTTYPTNWLTVSSTVQIVPGVWRYIAVTYDGSNVTIYEGGVQTAFAAAPQLAYWNMWGQYGVYIGGSSSSPIGIGNYKGAMDNLRVYAAHTLTSSEVSADMLH